MNEATASPLNGCPRVARLYRLQWEEAQQAHVLLFPEGMVKLNRSAGEILSRCDGSRTTAQIVAELEAAFETTALESEIQSFLASATQKGWVDWKAG